MAILIPESGTLKVKVSSELFLVILYATKQGRMQGAIRRIEVELAKDRTEQDNKIIR